MRFLLRLFLEGYLDIVKYVETKALTYASYIHNLDVINYIKNKTIIDLNI